MAHALDLNLLVALDLLLREGSVARAAQKAGLSAPAMSRALGRIREATRDPILVRAGRKLVPTPRAEALRERVQRLVEEAERVLTPRELIFDHRLERTFSIRTSDSAAGLLAAPLAARLQAEAPRVRLCFLGERAEDDDALREGRIDLEIGAIGAHAPEIRAQMLFRDRSVGVVREGHPLLREPITPRRFAGFTHAGVSRRGQARAPVDEALAKLGLTRSVGIVVTSFYAALAVAAQSDFVTVVPGSFARRVTLRQRLQWFPLPVPVPTLTLGQAWHPRFDADPGHRWLRASVKAVCGELVVEDRSSR